MPHNGTEIQNLPIESKRLRSPTFWRNVGILFSGVAAGVLIAVMVLASYGLLAINSRMANSIINLANNLNASQNAIADAQKSAANAEQFMQQTKEAMQAQSQMIADIQKAQHTNQDDVLIAEAGYLVLMASDGLQYENNIPLAIKLLQAADQDVAKISDTKVYPVRQAFAADLAALQGVSPVDVPGIYARLAALSTQIAKLPLLSELINNRADAIPQHDDTLPWWRRGLNSLREVLERIVVVRKSLPNVPAFVTPDQKIFLYQNLQMELEKAQWGLLHHQQDIYRLSLQQAIDWVKQYAVQDSPVTRELLQSIAQLQQINIHPNVPDLSNSLKALQSYKK